MSLLLATTVRTDEVLTTLADDGLEVAREVAALDLDRSPAEALWRTVLAGLLAVSAGRTAVAGLRIAAVPGTVLWDVETLGSPRPVSLGARTAPTLVAIAADEPHTWRLVRERRYAVGPPASYLLARLTRGLEHAVDVATATVGGLLDVSTGEWDGAACAALGLPVETLPELLDAGAVAGSTEPSAIAGLAIPVRLVGLS